MAGNGAEASYGDLLVMSLVVLGVVCVGAFVIVRLVGRVLTTGRSRGAHLLDVVARVPLEPRRSLYVVEVAGKTLLVGTSEMGLSVLSELDGAEVRARVVERPSFGDLVRTAWARRRGLRRTAQEEGAGAPRDRGEAAAKDAPRDAAGVGGVGGESREGGAGGGEAAAKDALREAAAAKDALREAAAAKDALREAVVAKDAARDAAAAKDAARDAAGGGVGGGEPREGGAGGVESREGGTGGGAGPGGRTP